MTTYDKGFTKQTVTHLYLTIALKLWHRNSKIMKTKYVTQLARNLEWMWPKWIEIIQWLLRIAP